MDLDQVTPPESVPPTDPRHQPRITMTQAVQEILERIREPPKEDRLVLDEQLAMLAEEEWKRDAEESRRLARQRNIDQAAIDQAVEKVRCAP